MLNSCINPCIGGFGNESGAINLDFKNIVLEDLIENPTTKLTPKFVKDLINFELATTDLLYTPPNTEHVIRRLNIALKAANFEMKEEDGTYRFKYIGKKEHMLDDIENLEIEVLKRPKFANDLHALCPGFLENMRELAENYAQPSVGVFDKLKTKLEQGYQNIKSRFSTVKSKIFKSDRASAQGSKPRKRSWFERHVAKKIPFPKPLEQPEQKVNLIYWLANDGRVLDVYKAQDVKGVDGDIFASMLTAVQNFVQEADKSGGKLTALPQENKILHLAHGKDTILVVEYETKKGKQAEIFDEALPSFLERLESKYRNVPAAFYKVIDSLKTLPRDTTLDALLQESDGIIDAYSKTPSEKLDSFEKVPARLRAFLQNVTAVYPQMEQVCEYALSNFKNTLPNWDGRADTYEGKLNEAASDITRLPAKQKVMEYKKRVADYRIKIDDEVKKLKFKVKAVAGAFMLLIPGIGWVFLGPQITEHTHNVPIPPVNSSPDIANITDQQVFVGQPYNLSIMASDADHDSLTYELKFEKNGTKLPIDSKTGILRIPVVPDSWLGKSLLNASVGDGHLNHTKSKYFNLTVSRPNAKPIMTEFNVNKNSPFLYVNASARDIDTGVAGLELFIDGEFYKPVSANSILDVIDLKLKRLAPGNHMMRARAQDAKDINLYSDWAEAPFYVSDKPVITKVNVSKDGTDNPLVTVDAYSESSSNIKFARAKVLGTNVTNEVGTPLDSEISQSVGLDLNGLPIKNYKIDVSVANEKGVESDYASTNATPFDDPITAKLTAKIDANDKLDWELSATDEEGQLTYASIAGTTPTSVATEKTQAPANEINMAGSLDLSQDVPGTYKIAGLAKDINGASANASATIVVKDHAPSYVFALNPQTTGNTLTVSVSGNDNDTLEEKIVLDVKGAVTDQKEKPLNSKQFNADWNFDWTYVEPGQVSLSAKLVPAAGQNSSEFVLFRDVPFTIYNDAPVIQDIQVYYNPVNKTVEIKGSGTDVDNTISGGDYLIINKATGQKTTGNINGSFDSKTADIKSVVDIKGTGLPEGNYWVNVTLRDKGGAISDIVSKEIEINNTYRVVPRWNPDENATEPYAEYDPDAKIAYIYILGNNTVADERVNDFDKLTSSDLRNYLKTDLALLIANGTIVPDDPILTADNLNSKIVSRFNNWAGGEARWTKDFRTSLEWLKWQLQHNNSLGISQAAKDKWSRLNALPINSQNDPFFVTLVNYDANNNNILEPSEKLIYVNAGVLQNQCSYLITDYDSFVSMYTDPNARNQTKNALIDAKDLEWRYIGNNWSGIDGLFNFGDSLTAKRAIGLVDRYGEGSNSKLLDEVAGALLSLYKVNDQPIFKDRKLEIYMPTPDSYELWVSG